MNVHHLELFYYVAKYEGIVAACRHIPYGIQQPAVSAQVAQLEADLGVRLFERRPFRLTDAGQALHDFAAPFFGRLKETELLLRGTMARRIRLAGLTEVMRDHVPSLLEKLRGKFPGLQVTLTEIDQRGAEQLIQRGEADLAITVLESKLPPGFRSITVAKLPICLVVPADSPYRQAADALRAGAAGELPLIGLPAHERLSRLFAAEMSRRKRQWKIGLEVSSSELVTTYVRHKLGAGLMVRRPGAKDDAHVRFLMLKGFPALPIGIFWRGKLGEVAELFLEGLKERAKIFLD